ncbi:P-loop containing nucleoside triphosphate hydrolase [Glarea lozoyensis ATCC 20868]|uniref:p-loop containing nucleoside triphosphate hydrolase n=1 Tax=Glarea lozoyensis (strain ATCC 20868 / MF5171) TaxID=1116229 RepID=S3CEG1_GLAL2|nr:P-loop containing nucleoside triphosphate hydrolase [Glarea lozoyensis ATCC 20868]EPE24867.1 P-loop containing nucleoside triphosphate hydrolase [Glarea lozoyensis ATCC 20868]
MESSAILAVMGITGAGKSSFIKLVTGDGSVKIGHSQLSETKKISSYNVYIRGKTFTLVDTPGFDDDNLSDSDVLKLLVDWLASTYKSGQKLNGILYLHRITDARMQGSSLRNLRVFKELICDGFHKNVTLGTTCWSLVPHSTAVPRETELKTSTSFWKSLIANGARLERIPNSAAEARNLVYEIASHDALALQTQRDIVDLGKAFGSLAVSKLVDHEFEELKRQQAAEIARRRGEEERERLRLERMQKEELDRIREKNRRMEGFKLKQAYCARKKPFGTCDKAGCENKLQSWKYTWREIAVPATRMTGSGIAGPVEMIAGSLNIHI